MMTGFVKNRITAFENMAKSESDLIKDTPPKVISVKQLISFYEVGICNNGTSDGVHGEKTIMTGTTHENEKLVSSSHDTTSFQTAPSKLDKETELQFDVADKQEDENVDLRVRNNTNDASEIEPEITPAVSFYGPRSGEARPNAVESNFGSTHVNAPATQVPSHILNSPKKSFVHAMVRKGLSIFHKASSNKSTAKAKAKGKESSNCRQEKKSMEKKPIEQSKTSSDSSQNSKKERPEEAQSSPVFLKLFSCFVTRGNSGQEGRQKQSKPHLSTDDFENVCVRKGKDRKTNGRKTKARAPGQDEQTVSPTNLPVLAFVPISKRGNNHPQVAVANLRLVFSVAQNSEEPVSIKDSDSYTLERLEQY